jgi:nucleoside phosphorylase
MASLVPARLVAEPQAEEFTPSLAGLPPLAAIDWAGAGLSAPKVLETPKTLAEVTADAVVIMWADAEWAPTHHVFCDSSASMPHSEGDSGSFPGWVKDDAGMVETQPGWTFWGWYRLVRVGEKRVLLYKSNTHYAYQGAAALTSLTKRLINLRTQPALIMSTGTAGGANSRDHVGTVVIVNSAALYESGKVATGWPTYSSTWRPPTARLDEVGQLLMPIPITDEDLSRLAQQFDKAQHADYTLGELDPLDLNHPDHIPEIRDLTGNGTALLTADSFLVGTTDNTYAAYACIEMDDAIIAEECHQEGIPYGSVRNLSDPAQNAALGKKGGSWGSAVYKAYGFYTSFNGALVAWAGVG